MSDRKILETEVEEMGHIYGTMATFYRSIRDLDSIGAGIVSARDFGHATRKNTNGGFLSVYGSVISEGCLNIPRHIYHVNGGILLLRKSHILRSEDFIKRATKSHKNESDFYIDEGEVREYIERSNKRDEGLFVLGDRRALDMRKLYSDPRTIWLFQGEAEEVGKFLYDKGKREMVFTFDSEDTINASFRPYTNQLYLSLHTNTARLTGNFKHLDDNVFVCGKPNENNCNGKSGNH